MRQDESQQGQVLRQRGASRLLPQAQLPNTKASAPLRCLRAAALTGLWGTQHTSCSPAAAKATPGRPRRACTVSRQAREAETTRQVARLQQHRASCPAEEARLVGPTWIKACDSRTAAAANAQHAAHLPCRLAGVTRPALRQSTSAGPAARAVTATAAAAAAAPVPPGSAPLLGPPVDGTLSELSMAAWNSTHVVADHSFSPDQCVRDGSLLSCVQQAPPRQWRGVWKPRRGDSLPSCSRSAATLIGQTQVLPMDKHSAVKYLAQQAAHTPQ